MDEKTLIDFGLLRWGEAGDPVEMFGGPQGFGAAGAEFKARELFTRRGQDDKAYEAAPREAKEGVEALLLKYVTGGVELHVVGGEAVHPEALGSQ